MQGCVSRSQRKRYKEIGMNRRKGSSVCSFARIVTAVVCIGVLVPGETPLLGQQQAKPQTAPTKITSDQLDSLVAPIALYPDPLLAQTLASSTYPLEIIQLQQWLEK